MPQIVKVRVTSPAQADITDVFEWYVQRNQRAAVRFLGAVDAGMTAISEHPEAYRKVRADVRRVLLRRFPYHLLFRVLATEIEVIGCFHVQRDPRIWQHRIG